MKNKKGILIILIIIILLICILCNTFKNKIYEKDYSYFDTYINVKIYTKNSKKVTEIFDEIDKIYSEYHKLTDRYNSYPGLTNLYTINNNVLTDKYLEIDEKLIDLINYGINMYKWSNGKVDISMGNVIDIWKGYRESNLGIPTLEELQYVNYNNIEQIEIKNNKIKNNNLNIDLGAISKGYVTQKVGEYLKSIGIEKYLINAGGNVLTGSSYKKEKYKIGLENPNNQNDIYKIIKVENKAVVTSGGYLRYYEYNGTKYHHIIDPETLYPTNYSKSVTVITSDSAYADFLSTYLFLLPVDEGINYVNNLKDVEAIWYLNDDTTKTSKGFNKYE